MKTIGIGVDIVKNKRIHYSINKKNFINRTFGKNEILFSQKIINKTSYFSKRFAAKESLAKALGTGFRDGLNFKDIQIINDKLRHVEEILEKYDETRPLMDLVYSNDMYEESLKMAEEIASESVKQNMIKFIKHLF